MNNKSISVLTAIFWSRVVLTSAFYEWATLLEIVLPNQGELGFL